MAKYMPCNDTKNKILPLKKGTLEETYKKNDPLAYKENRETNKS